MVGGDGVALVSGVGIGNVLENGLKVIPRGIEIGQSASQIESGAQQAQPGMVIEDRGKVPGSKLRAELVTCHRRAAMGEPPVLVAFGQGDAVPLQGGGQLPRILGLARD